jgi:hypothetical protein
MSMSPLLQPLHIFRKDARHLWPETLISIALLAAYAWAELQTWKQPVTQGASGSAALVAVLLVLLVWLVVFLLLVIWLVLTSRLVHDEELVGDRQFWITRPYTWHSLLVSKIFYLFVLVGLPLAAMQMWLLHHAGLYPMLVLPALAKNLLLIAAVFLLPLLAIAAVTATFVRYMLSVVAGFIYFVVVSIVVGLNWPEKLDVPYLGHLISWTLLLILLAALVLQYWKRKTMIARLMLLAVPLVFLALTLLTPSNLLSDHRYPDVSSGKLSFIGDFVPPQGNGPLMVFQHKNVIQIPVQAQLKDTSDDSFLQVQRIRLDIDGPNGFHYSSGWIGDDAEFSSEDSVSKLPFVLPEKVFEQIRHQPVAMHIELGTQSFHASQSYTVSATEKPFPIPGHATCTVSTADGSLECHFPFSKPQAMLITATVHNGNCQAPGPLSAPAVGTFDPSIPLLIHFSPVEIARVSLNYSGTKVPLCPGTPTTFKTGVEGDYSRIHLDIPSIVLDAYAAHFPGRPAQSNPNTQPNTSESH